MKKVALSIIMFAIAIALVVGIIIPIAEKAQDTGDKARTNQSGIDDAISSLADTGT